MELPYVLSILCFFSEIAAFLYSRSLSSDMRDILSRYWDRLRVALVVCILSSLGALFPWVRDLILFAAVRASIQPVIAFAIITAVFLPIVQTYTYFVRRRAMSE
jgi:hypothetical protein